MHNVTEALRTVQPYAVDAFTSVTSEGKLDRLKVRNFLAAVRQLRLNR